METKIIKEPVYKIEKIKTGEIDKTIYVAIDGKEFQWPDDCQEHERNLLLIKDCEGLIEKINLNGDQQDAISTLIFGGSDVSSAIFFKWKATKDKTVIDKVYLYLLSQKCSIYTNELMGFEEGDNVLISSWIEFEYSDYPKYETKAIKYEDAIKIIDELSDNMKSVFKS
jgi:hypothetical protein